MPLTSSCGIFSSLSLCFFMFSFSFWSYQRIADTEQLFNAGILKQTLWSLFCAACQSCNCSVAQNASKENWFKKSSESDPKPSDISDLPSTWWDLERELCISITKSITSFKLKKQKKKKKEVENGSVTSSHEYTSD